MFLLILSSLSTLSLSVFCLVTQCYVRISPSLQLLSILFSALSLSLSGVFTFTAGLRITQNTHLSFLHCISQFFSTGHRPNQLIPNFVCFFNPLQTPLLSLSYSPWSPILLFLDRLLLAPGFLINYWNVNSAFLFFLLFAFLHRLTLFRSWSQFYSPFPVFPFFFGSSLSAVVF